MGLEWPVTTHPGPTISAGELGPVWVLVSLEGHHYSHKTRNKNPHAGTCIAVSHQVVEANKGNGILAEGLGADCRQGSSSGLHGRLGVLYGLASFGGGGACAVQNSLGVEPLVGEKALHLADAGLQQETIYQYCSPYCVPKAAGQAADNDL